MYNINVLRPRKKQKQFLTGMTTFGSSSVFFLSRTQKKTKNKKLDGVTPVKFSSLFFLFYFRTCIGTTVFFLFLGRFLKKFFVAFFFFNYRDKRTSFFKRVLSTNNIFFFFWRRAAARVCCVFIKTASGRMSIQSRYNYNIVTRVGLFFYLFPLKPVHK